jgi:hypothetical protein
MRRNLVKERLKYHKERFDDWREKLSAEQFRSQLEEIAEGPPSPALRRAAEFFGLDSTDPVDSGVLLDVLADAAFYESKKGRKKGSNQWTTERLLTLGFRLHELEKAAGSRISYSEAAKKIKNDYSDYKYLRERVIRERLPDAREVFELKKRNWRLELKPIKTPQGMVITVGQLREVLRGGLLQTKTLIEFLNTRKGRKALHQRLELFEEFFANANRVRARLRSILAAQKGIAGRGRRRKRPGSSVPLAAE